MKGVYLTYLSSAEGNRTLVARVEEHVILPELTEMEVLVQVKACGLSRVDIKTLLELMPGAEQFPVGSEVSGVVVNVGSAVKSFVPNDEVCGILPLTSDYPGCAEYCIVPDYCLVKKPRAVSHVECAASLKSGIRAYTGLLYQARVQPRTTAVIFSATSADCQIMIQMCESLNVKVIACVNNQEEMDLLLSRYPSIYKVVNLNTVKDLVSACLQETGGLGANCIIDPGVAPGYSLSEFLIESDTLRKRLEEEVGRYEYETTSLAAVPLPTKHQIISSLAVHGQWVTSQPALQLEPPESIQLHLKGASIHFLFDPAWTLSCSQQGKYLHILSDVLFKLKEGTLTPVPHKIVNMSQVCEELVQLGSCQEEKVVMKFEGFL